MEKGEALQVRLEHPGGPPGAWRLEPEAGLFVLGSDNFLFLRTGRTLTGADLGYVEGRADELLTIMSVPSGTLISI